MDRSLYDHHALCRQTVDWQARSARPAACRTAVLALLAGLILSTVWNTQAATLTWTGGGNGGNTSDWSAKQNWGNSAPESTDNIVFSSTVGNSSTPTLSADTSANSITFVSGAAAFNIGGAYTLTIGSGGIVNNSATTEIFSVQTVELGASQTWNTASGSLSLTGSSLNLAGYTLTTQGAFSLSLGVKIIGIGGAITESGSGVVTLSGLLANSYTGLTTVSAGELDLNKTGVIAVAGDLAVSGGTVKLLQSNQIANGSTVLISSGTLAVQSFTDTIDELELRGGSISGSGGRLISSFAVDAESGSVSVNLGGSTGLTKTAAGIVTLAGTDSYTGATSILGGTLIVQGSLSGSSAVTVGDSTHLATPAVLAGGGSLGNLTLGAAADNTGAWVEPSGGAAESTTTGGTSLGTGSFTVFAGSEATIALEVGRTAATSGHAVNTGDTSDHIRTTGNVTLDGNLQLTLQTGYTPALHDVLYLIINGSGNTISGRFASVNGSALAGNGRFVFDGATWQLTTTANYNSSSFSNGNDLAIEVIAIPEPANVGMFLSGAGMLVLLRRCRRLGR